MNGNMLDGTQRSNAGFDAISAGEEYVFDATEIVQNWLDGDANYGFLFDKIDIDGWEFSLDDLAWNYTSRLPPPQMDKSQNLLRSPCGD